MRYYLILMETINNVREISILHSFTDKNEAVDTLIYESDIREADVINGKCRVLMTTYTE